MSNPFDYDEVLASEQPEVVSRKGQIVRKLCLIMLYTDTNTTMVQAALASSSSDELAQLHARYPANNIPHLFPDKRVYEHKGRYWDLTPLRLQIWAQHMVCLFVTEACLANLDVIGSKISND